jgi:hypothetical protein
MAVVFIKVFHDLLASGWVVGLRSGFNSVFLKQLGDLSVVFLQLESGEVSDHSRADLLRQLGACLDELLLGLKLLLLGLDRELTGLDIVLFFLKCSLEALVSKTTRKEPQTKQNGESRSADGKDLQ